MARFKNISSKIKHSLHDVQLVELRSQSKQFDHIGKRGTLKLLIQFKFLYFIRKIIEKRM